MNFINLQCMWYLYTYYIEACVSTTYRVLEWIILLMYLYTMLRSFQLFTIDSIELVLVHCVKSTEMRNRHRGRAYSGDAINNAARYSCLWLLLCWQSSYILKRCYRSARGWTVRHWQSKIAYNNIHGKQAVNTCVVPLTSFNDTFGWPDH